MCQDRNIIEIHRDQALGQMSCPNPADHGFRDRIQKLSEISAAEFATLECLGLTRAGKVRVIDIPRGGQATGDGVFAALQNKIGAPVFHSRSVYKDQTRQPLADIDDLNECSHLVLVDGIVSTGHTMIDHIMSLPEKWPGTLIVFSNGTTHVGSHNIRTLGKDRQLNLFQICNRLFSDDECDWVKNSEAKEAYFVGYNKKNGIDYKIPDFGDQLSLG
jgi:hypothetical protein